MCGIVGYCGSAPAAPVLMDGLARMEYRGYDSSGIALLDQGELMIERRAGKIGALRSAIAGRSLSATTGIAHTRWATHGAPTDDNAHPHRDCHDRIAVVHNGIIENFDTLRVELEARGHRFRSETDSEVIAHLVEGADQGDLRAAVQEILPRLEGAFAIAISHVDHPDQLIGVRRHAPLIAGRSAEAGFLASDPTALAGSADEVVYLEDGDLVDVHRGRLDVFDQQGAAVDRGSARLADDTVEKSKGGYAHYMLKEIMEQPQALRSAIAGRVRQGRIHLPELEGLHAQIAAATRVEIVACGSAHYASAVAARLIERWSGLPTRTTVASEFRYSPPSIDGQTLLIAVSQSGETADTLAAVRIAQAAGAPVIAIVNAAGSSLARAADATVLLQAGPEIAVAATKSFTTQATVGIMVAAVIARLRGRLQPAFERTLAASLRALPEQAATAVAWSERAVPLARRLETAVGFLFLGRGAGLPAAMEGALKLKEVSYLHADGYPAGELKHGPIAIVERARPVVAVATASDTRAKLLSNLMEAKARDGLIIVVTEPEATAVEAVADELLYIPPCDEEFAPILAVIPLQRLAYEHAVARGLDVDQPRNIAKSVTVE